MLSIQKTSEEITSLKDCEVLGWVSLNTVTLKQDLFTLVAKWGLPFSHLMIGRVSQVTRRWVQLLKETHRNFDPTFLPLSTQQKIETIRKTRADTEAAEDVDVFFERLQGRVGVAEEGDVVLSPSVVWGGE
jgi:hypothetical protein